MNSSIAPQTSTPTRLPPPPRRVRGSFGRAAGLWFARIFTLPHTVIGIGALGYWLFLLLWVLLGSDLPGVAVGSDVHQSRKGGTSYTVKYQYQIGNETKSGSSGVSQAVYEHIRSVDAEKPPVRVRYFRLGPLEHAELHKGGGTWPMIGFFTIWVVFWNSIMSVFVYMIWIKPVRLRLLYKYGEATFGTLAAKRIHTGKSSTYYVSYTFKHPVSGEMIRGETQVPNFGVWSTARQGQSVTVLYASNKPKRNAIYELSGYRVDDARE